MTEYRRHLPPDASLPSLHVALNRLWEALEAQGGVSRSATPTRPTPLGSSPAFTAATGAPTTTSHNALSGIQGGDTDNYYHLKQVEYTGTGTGVFVRQVSPTLTGSITLATVIAGLWNGTKIGLAYGGTNADLSGTGGASQVLRQSVLGGAVTVSRLMGSDVILTGYVANGSNAQISATNTVNDAFQLVQHQINDKGQINTGLISGGLITINGGDNTKFDVAAAALYFEDYSNPLIGNGTHLAYAGAVAQTVTNLATQNVTYIGVNAAGTIIQQADPFTNIQRRTIVSLGLVVHSNRTNISGVNLLGATNLSTTGQLHDFMLAVGPLNITGNIYSANGANLNINKTSGSIFKYGVAAQTVPLDPHTLTQGAGTALTFRYRLNTGTEYVDTTSIDPNYYDLAGVRTAVTANKWTVQRIFMFQSGLTRIQYGQTQYTKQSDAIASYMTDVFIVEQNILENGVLRGYLVVQQGATALNNPAQATWFDVMKFGASMLGAGGTIITNFSDLTGTCATTQGGTGLTSYTLGDMLYASAANVLSTLAGYTAAAMAVLTMTGTGTAAAAPVWTATTGSGNVVRATSPALVTPVLGVASATSLTIAKDGSGISLSPAVGITGTAATWVQFGNAGGTLYVGRDSSTGASFGGSAYATVFYNSSNTSMDFYTTATRRLSISGAGDVSVTSTTASTSSTTGALTVAGGVGIGGALNAAGDINTSGNFKTLGNAGLAFGYDTAAKSMSIGYGSGGTTNFGTTYIYDGKTSLLATFATTGITLATAVSTGALAATQVSASQTVPSYYNGSVWFGTDPTPFANVSAFVKVANTNVGGYDSGFIAYGATSTGVLKPAFMWEWSGTGAWTNGSVSTQTAIVRLLTRDNADALVTRLSVDSTGATLVTGPLAVNSGVALSGYGLAVGGNIRLSTANTWIAGNTSLTLYGDTASGTGLTINAAGAVSMGVLTALGGKFTGSVITAGANAIWIDVAGGGRIGTVGPNASTFAAWGIDQYTSDLSGYRRALDLSAAGTLSMGGGAFIVTSAGALSAPSLRATSGGALYLNNAANTNAITAYHDGTSLNIDHALTSTNGTVNATLNGTAAGHPYLYMSDGTYTSYVDISASVFRLVFNSIDALRVSTAGLATFANAVVQAPVAFASLPAGTSGMRYMINNNSASPAFGSAANGTGAATVPVYHDGVSWKVG